jgi:hypothetical protein
VCVCVCVCVCAGAGLVQKNALCEYLAPVNCRLQDARPPLSSFLTDCSLLRQGRETNTHAQTHTLRKGRGRASGRVISWDSSKTTTTSESEGTQIQTQTQTHTHTQRGKETRTYLTGNNGGTFIGPPRRTQCPDTKGESPSGCTGNKHKAERRSTTYLGADEGDHVRNHVAARHEVEAGLATVRTRGSTARHPWSFAKMQERRGVLFLLLTKWAKPGARILQR